MSASLAVREPALARLTNRLERVRDEVEAWVDAGVKTPILVPSSTKGGQMVAIKEMFDTFAS